MAHFDVFARADGEQGLLLDCQADLLSHLNTCFVVPLVPVDAAPRPAVRLNPVFEILDVAHIMITQFAAAVLTRELGDEVTSLGQQDIVVADALDVLMSGV
jgi:toxin CcdB